MDSSQTVFLVDDDEGAPLSVVALLQAHEFDCRGFDSASAFLSAYDPRMTGCLVTDLAMPGGLAGIELHRELQHRGWIIPTIVIAGNVGVPEAVEAMQLGVISVLEKPFEQQDLLDGVRLALETDSRVRANAQKLTELNRLFAQLTEGETAVLDRLVAGKPNKVIAEELDVAVRTIEYRRQRLSQKLGVQKVGSLVALVVERDQLVSRDPDALALVRAWDGDDAAHLT